MTKEEFKENADRHLDDLLSLIRLMPHKDEKEHQSRKMALFNRLMALEAAVNDVTEDDFIED